MRKACSVRRPEVVRVSGEVMSPIDEALRVRLENMSPAKRALFLSTVGLPPELAKQFAAATPAVQSKTSIPRRADGVAPLSFGQELLWLLQLATPGFAAYNAPRAYRVRGPLDIAALQTALDAHVERHEIYRSVIRSNGSALVQEVRPARPVELRVADVRGELASLAPSSRDASIAVHTRAAMREPFDLERDQLLRGTVLRIGENEHIVVLVSHHIASDGWSRGVMFREIAAFYDAAVNGTNAALDPLPIQYADFAAWQREYLAGERLARVLAFWRSQLAGAPATLELPTDRPRSGMPSAEGARVTGLFPPEITAGLKTLARKHDATLFMVLLAAWQVLLSRYSSQDDVLVGTPIAGRAMPELEGLVGYFADTLVIRGQLHGEPTFTEFLARVRERSLAAFDHQDVPYEKLVLEMAQERGGSTAPLFQSLFVMHDDHPARLSLAGATVESFAADGGWTKADVSLSVSDRADGLGVVLEYRTDAFDHERMARMLGHFRTLLESILVAPETSVARLEMLSAAEREQFDTWNSTAHSYSHDHTLIQCIEATVARTPNAVALQVDSGDTMTFAESNRRANQLAHRLVREGVRPGVGVALCFERSFELVIGQLGAMKAGGHYVPLDPSYPKDRLAFMLEDSEAPVVLTNTAQRSVLPEDLAPAKMIVLDAERADIERESESTPESRVATEDLAYVIYTSGSTGRPKGVMIPHRAVVNYIEWMQRTFPVSGADGILQKAPASFDASIWEFFLPLVAGARLVLAKPGGQQDPDYLMRTIVRHGVTVMQLVPSQLQMVLDSPSASLLGGLRLLALGGEALPGDLLARLDRVAPVPTVNLYGPTECTVYAMSWTHDPRTDGPWDGSPVPIGKPIHNTQVYVVDPMTMEQQPIGVPGELLIGGVQVARGYHNRPELNAEKFVADPFTGGKTGLYRTGDLAVRRGHGVVDYLGRIDNQIKLRGFRIELGEIEESLLRHRAIRQCVVLLREDAPGDRQLVAYVAFEPGRHENAAVLREFLRTGLPEYMVPTAFVALDAIPLNANGKVDRRTLLARPHVVEGGATKTSPYVAPRTTIEHELRDIWESLLAHRPIGIQDDFFAIGGHSLLAMRMLIEIERVRGRRLPVATLFEQTTIEKLAAVITRQVEDDGEPPLVVLNEGARGIPLVFVHGDVRGGGWYCRRLAERLVDRPIIVLPTFRPGKDVPATVEAMAERHIAELRKVRPHGPYVVGGFCAGGLVAYEIAQQLVENGDRVALLVVADTAAVNAGFRPLLPLLSLISAVTPEPRRLNRRAAVLRKARYYRARLRDLKRRSASERVDWFFRNIERRARGIGTFAVKSVSRGNHSNGQQLATKAADELSASARAANHEEIDEEAQLMGTGVAGPGLQTLLFQRRAAVAYVQRPYTGAMHAVLATKTPGVRRVGARGWERLAPRIQVTELESSHLGLITRDLPAFAERLAQILESIPPQ